SFYYLLRHRGAPCTCSPARSPMMWANCVDPPGRRGSAAASFRIEGARGSTSRGRGTAPSVEGRVSADAGPLRAVPGRIRMNRRAMVMVMVLAAVGAAALANAGASGRRPAVAEQPDPAAILQQLTDAIGQSDLAATMALFTDDAVFLGGPTCFP